VAGVMVAGVDIVWLGHELETKTARASKYALTRVSRRAARNMAQFTAETFQVITGRARDSCQAKSTTEAGGIFVSEFGSYGVDYYRYLNFGTRYIEPGNMLQRAADIAQSELPGAVVADVRGASY
jgi:hypothetical protein